MEKYFNKLKIILLVVSLLFTGFESFPQFLKGVYPDYNNTHLVMTWNAIGGAQAYATRYKINTSAWSAWDSMGTATFRTINLALNSASDYYTQVRARRAGLWDTVSNIVSTNTRSYWPALNKAGTGPSRNLLHNFLQPIDAGGSIYLHEGVDINGDYNDTMEKVIAAFSGIIDGCGWGTSGWGCFVRVKKNNSFYYYSYNHLIPNPRIKNGYTVAAGDTIGTIVDSFWNAQCYHVHFHYHLNNAQYVRSTKNPLSLFSNNIDRDPAGNAPVSLNTNNDTSFFKIRGDATGTYYPKDTVAYHAVDFVWELLDRKSDHFYQIPEKVGYYIEKQTAGGGWSPCVRSAASPYLLYHNDTFLGSAFGSMWVSIGNALFDYANNKKSTVAAITPKPDYVFEQWFTWKLANAVDSTGHVLDADQCWATNARKTVASDNGYTAGYAVARSFEDAKFQDGLYRITAVAYDLVNNASFSKVVTVDNFKPYIKEVAVYNGSTKIYEGKWEWNDGAGNYQYSKTTDNEGACNDSLKIIVKTSEAISQMTVAIPTLGFTQTKTRAVDTTTKTEWQFSVPASTVENHTQVKHKIEISAQDLNHEGIVGFQNTNPFPGANVPKKQQNGTWNPNTAAISDKSHIFKLDSLDNIQMQKQDVKCYGENNGWARAIPSGGTSPYTYLWNYQGRTSQTITGIPAGNYEVTVKDNKGCKGKKDTIVKEPSKLYASIAGGPAVIPFCIQDGAPSVTLTASASGGTPPYTYSWPGQVKVVSSSGIYSVTVTDSGHCTATASTFMLFIPVLCSRDPNDITGPEGYSTPRFIARTETMPYTIRFENDPDFASAPAQKVVVTLPFHAKHDMYSFRLKSFGFGDFTYQVPANKTSYTTRLDVEDSLGVYVDFIAGINPTTGEAFWEFESIDPNTGLPPIDPTKGFLLVNDSRHRGEGFVSFTVNPKSSATSGDTIKAQAKIVFDVHSPIYTNEWFNVVDAIAPTSKTDTLPPEVDSGNFLVSWAGHDDTKGSGIANYELYYSENNNAFQLFKKDIADTSTLFSGNYGSNYRFYTRAKDNVGNKEATKTTAEARTRIKPFRLFLLPDSNSFYCKGAPIIINWRKINMEFINLKYSADSGSSWNTIASAVEVEDSVYTWYMPDSLPSNQYYKLMATNPDNDYPVNTSDYFYVSNHPTAEAGTDKNLCPGTTVAIGGSPTASGSIPPYSYAWTPSSSLNFDSVSNPVALPTVNTLYRVIVKDSIGCTGTDSVMVSLRPGPAVQMIINDASQCLANNFFIFKDNSTISSGTLTKAWKFGDGTTATGDSVTHSYSSAGKFAVKLIVTSNFGCTDSVIDTAYVRNAPLASFTVNDSDQCLAGNSFIFTNTSTISYGNLTYKWKFDNTDSATVTNPVKTFSTIGNHQVLLIAYSPEGCSDTFYRTLQVDPVPSAVFSIIDSSRCLSGNSFTFSNSSSISSGTLTYLWKFGDNSTSTVTNPVKSYTNAGNYSARLVATSNKGCKDSSSKNVYVRPQPVTAFNIADSSLCFRGNNFVFTNNSSISSGTFTNLWKFGDNSNSTSTSPAHAYTLAGTFSVRLVTTSDNGCKDSISKNVYVRPHPVTVFTIGDSSLCLRGNNFVFTNNSSISSGTFTNLWKFGDNTTSSANSPSHTYTNAGNYSARLVTTSNYGCKDSTGKNVIVRPHPATTFNIADSSLCFRGNNFVFTNNSSIPSGTFTNLWKFGDSTSSSSAAPSHSYSAAGSYSVILVTTSNYGCKDSISKNVYVRPHPVTAFNIADSSLCLRGNNFVFTNSTSISLGTFTNLWKFGDNTSGTVTSPTHSYSAVGTYSVRLITTSNFGCKDSSSKNVYTRPHPVTTFSLADSSLCFRGNNFVFTNNSSISSGTYTNLWKFGDNISNTTASPAHSYSVAGNYSARLVTTSNYGCKDSISKNVYVRPHPVTAFNIADSSLCLRGNNFLFSNNTSISSGTYTSLWKFGDNSTSTANSPNHGYSAVGTYSVRLVTTSNYGCKDSINKNVYTRPHPVTSFILSDSSLCFRGNSFAFTNNSSIPAGTLTNLWKFGDNTTSTTSSPNHTYALAGNYSARLITTSNYGCKDSISKNIYVRPHPLTAFNIADTSLCFRGNNFSFTNNTSISSGSWSNLWKFGDNTSSTSTSTAHSYSVVGTYTVRLVTSSNFGCKDSITKNVYVRPHPVTAFSIDDSSKCLRGNEFSFTNNSYIASGTYTNLWKFGDNTTNSTTSPKHTYTTIGNYSARLVTTSSYGCKDSFSKNVYVRPHPATVFSIADTSKCLRGNNFIFTNNTNITSGTFTNLWKFGDNTTSISTSPAHSYSATGTYTVRLVTTSNYNCTDSISKNVYVRPHPATAFNITDSSLCLRGNNFIFTNNSSISAGTFTSLWKFGDNATSTGTSPTHSYTAVGTYSARLVTTSNYGCKDSTSKNTYVRTHPVTAFNIADSSLCFRGNNFVFTNNSSIPTGTYTNLWKFGDNITSTTASPTHNYTAPGNYSARLVTTSNYGCKDSTSKNVYVRPHPVTTFNITDSSLCLNGNNFIFTNGSTISTGSFTNLWKFGDNSTSTVISPTHGYSAVGTYTVRLVTTSNYGCKDSISKNVYTRPHPVTAFSIADTSLCQRGNNFAFTNNSSISSGTCTNLWKFGDNITTTITSPNHTYTTAGNYAARLVTTSNYGCKDSLSKNVYVRPHPVTAFNISDSSLCFRGNNFSFTNNSTISSGIYTNLWRFGDNFTSTTTSPAHAYASVGTYPVRLVTTSSYGCKDSITKNVYVRPHPATDFTVNDSTQCSRGNNFIFTNNSSISSGSYSNLWNFGDSIVSTVISPSHLYAASDRTYIVKLVATSGFGCRDSITKTMVVYPHPASAFSVNDSGQCFNGNNFIFTNNSMISSGTFSNLWNFGDLSTSVLPNPSYSYSATDTVFNVKLVTTSGFGCADSTSFPVRIYPQPVADFSINDSSQCFSGNNFIFTDATSISSGTHTVYWDLGDGTTSTIPVVNYNYYIPDTSFKVKLTATSDQGCSDSITKKIYIFSFPNADFVVNDTDQCLDGNVFIFNALDLNVDSWHWDFGNSTTSGQSDDTLTYSAAGTFVVMLKVSTKEGCSDSMVKTVHVYPQPADSFSMAYGADGQVTFNPYAGINHTYLWKFGDGNTSTQISPTHKYSANGNYVVTVEVTNLYGCKTTGYDTAKVRNSLGTEEFSFNANNVKIYPNPTKGLVNIEIYNPNHEEFTVSLYDMKWKMLSYRQYNRDETVIKETMDISMHAKGMYMFRINTGRKVIYYKIILH